MGMTAATLLLDLGLNVTIYSDRKPADTTSSKAGGQWAVSVIEFQGKEQELSGIIKTAYTTFKNSIGNGFRVSEQPKLYATRSHNLDIVLQLAPGLIPPPSPCHECLSRDTLAWIRISDPADRAADLSRAA